MRKIIVTEGQLVNFIETKKSEKIFYDIVADMHENRKNLNENVSICGANQSVIDNYSRKNLINIKVNEMLIKFGIINGKTYNINESTITKQLKKKAYIIHGWDGSPQEPLIEWIRIELIKLNYNVIVPKMPNPNKPKIKNWVDKIKEITNSLNNNDIFIGHSIGCQAILRYLENINDNIFIDKIILIAPWITLDKNTIKEEGDEIIKIAKPWMETPINYNKIKPHVNEIISLFSTNDPYVPLSNSKIFKKELDSKIIKLNNKGHFDEASISELPELIKLLKQ